MSSPLMMLILCLVLQLSPGLAHATEEYARMTGQNCGYCHLDASGGGELTPAGTAWRSANLSTETGQVMVSAKKVSRLIVGFLHILTGIFWFGTILYVHLVLKPGYAAKGLPRGEMVVGLGSMFIMAVTGTILTIFRLDSLDMLLHTRFGILLMVKTSLFLLMVCSAMFVLLVIAPRLRRGTVRRPSGENGEMDAAELAGFDGKEGRKAYFGYQGRVYDATASRLWSNGVHMRRHQAGMDLTEALKLAPHGEDKIAALPVAASLCVNLETETLTKPQKAFYLTAYLNLAAVFCIILILALWRWW